ncbi:hypothetical protein CN918_30875 [Priestia megaterium]|nr:hypothetical protein CN918_30875 [Priestia megaterium]
MNNSLDLTQYKAFAEELLVQCRVPYLTIENDETTQTERLFSLNVYQESFCHANRRIITLPQYILKNQAGVLPSACLLLLHLIHQAAHALNPETVKKERIARCLEMQQYQYDYCMRFPHHYLQEEAYALEKGLKLLEQIDNSYIEWATGDPSREKIQQLYSGFGMFSKQRFMDEQRERLHLTKEEYAETELAKRGIDYNAFHHIHEHHIDAFELDNSLKVEFTTY